MRQALFAMLLVPLLGSAAFAQGNQYGVVAISNPTNVTIHYDFKWGDGSWQSCTILPGHVQWHSWHYAYTDQDSSPVPYVRFDADLSPGVYMQSYRLQAYAVPYDGVNGAKLYAFETFHYGAFLDLVSAD